MAANMKWLRLYNETPGDVKLRLVARESGQTVATVLAVWVAMLCHASEQGDEHRGTLHRWRDIHASVTLDLPLNVVAAVRAAMDGILLAGDRIESWAKRQQPADATAATRMQAYRARKRAAKQGIPEPSRQKDGVASPVTGVTARDVTGDGVTGRGEERREDQRKSPDGDSPTLPSPRGAQAAAGAAGPAAAPPGAGDGPAPLPRKRPMAPTMPEGFAEFWQAYPRGEKKQEALRAYGRVLGSGVTPATLLVAVRAFPFDLREAGRFVPHAATWLNQRRWEDERRNPAPAASSAGMYDLDAMAARIRARDAARGASASSPSDLFGPALGPVIDGDLA